MKLCIWVLVSLVAAAIVVRWVRAREWNEELADEDPLGSDRGGPVG